MELRRGRFGDLSTHRKIAAGMNANEREKADSRNKGWALLGGRVWFVAVSGVRVFRVRRGIAWRTGGDF